MTHRDNIKSQHKARQASLARAAMLYVETYLLFVSANSAHMVRQLRRIARKR